MKRIRTLIFWLAVSGLAASAHGQIISQTRGSPDPDIFDGTLVENTEREDQEPYIARVGDYNIKGTSLEGMEAVQGWKMPQPEEGAEGGQVGGMGRGEQGQESEENREELMVGADVDEEGVIGAGGMRELEGEEQGQGRQGGGMGGQAGMPPQGMQQGSGNPLAILAAITQAARGGGEGEEEMGGRIPPRSESPDELSYGNNEYRVDSAYHREDTMGQRDPDQQESASSARDAATGRQEAHRGTGRRETGDDMPTDI